MKVLLIEDEPQAASHMEKLLRQIDHEIEIVSKIDSVKNAVEWFRINPLPDLIFMDIQLADGISFEIFEQSEVLSPVIFTTAYDEYALKAFKVNSIDYLLKPIDKDELIRALKKHEAFSPRKDEHSRALEKIDNVMNMLTHKYKERFVTKVGEHLRFIDVSDVLYFTSEEKITFCHTKEIRKHILDFTLDQLEQLVDPAKYFRINRKYIVSVEAIRDMIHHTNSRLKLLLKACEDTDVIVARERVQEFKKWLDR